MKNILILLLLSLLIGCSPEIEFESIDQEIPENLEITKEVGIKLESRFASDAILMNVKINAAGIFTIKVIDIDNQVVSKEIVKGDIGDNLFKVYTNTLPISSYRIELFCNDDKVGNEVINLL